MKVENQIENAKDTIKTRGLVRAIYVIAPYSAVVIIVAAWYLASGKNVRIFPTPILVLKKIYSLLVKPLSGTTLFGHVAASLRRVFAALFFAIIIGIPFGVLVGWSRTVRSTLGALFECFRPIPVLAWIPLMVMWFGIGEQAKIIMIFIGTFMPIVVNSYTGIKMVAPIYLDVGRMFNAATQRQLLTKIVFPAALPAIFAGIRNATSVGLMVVLAAEMLAAKSGLGFLIFRGMEVFDISLVMAGMVCIGLTGAFLAFITNIVERKLCPWNRGLSSE
jgi:ABC-type nitrate/sulfonate/bicarbonate transport system permease component